MSLRCQNLCQCHQPGTHRHRIAIEGAEMNHLLVIDMSHNFPATSEGPNRHTTANGFGETHQVWFDRVEFGNTAGSNRHTCFYFIEDQQYTVAARDLPHILEITLFRQDNPNVHEHSFHDDCRNLAL